MTGQGPIRVLVVEDSPAARELMVRLLSSDPRIEIAGTARDGREALQAVKDLHPDVITMDVLMPGMDGLEATRQIMGDHPVPIVIVSGTIHRQEMATTFEALKAGAVAAIPRPVGPWNPDFDRTRQELLHTVKAIAGIRLVRRWQRAEVKSPPAHPCIPPLPPRAVALGASTGGPEALHRILSELPGEYPFPLLVVQHMASGFLEGLSQWLGSSTSLEVSLAREGERIRPGSVLIAPDGHHMGVTPGGRIQLSDAPPEKGVRPAVGYLFRSLLQAFGCRNVAALLTGMGRDGVDELKRLRDAGAVTIAQNRESSIVFGMPGEAVKAGAALHQLSPPQISELLKKMASDSNDPGKEPHGRPQT